MCSGIVANQNENELIMSSVLTALYESIATMLKGQIDRRSIMENLEIVMMAMDELVDDGMIMEIDADQVPIGLKLPHTAHPTHTLLPDNSRALAQIVAHISSRDSGQGAQGAMGAAAAAVRSGGGQSATSSFASAFASATRSLLK
jgi:hypothetical protein